MNKLDMLWANAQEVPFDEGSKFILMSDCHRSDASTADNFVKNKSIYLVAMQYYEKRDYTYIELGDGDELWENRSMEEITDAHGDVFEMLARFHNKRRYHTIYGNHDIVKKQAFWARHNILMYADASATKRHALFTDLSVPEAIVLRHKTSAREILLIHGHQVDFFNDELWRLSRFLVRYVWRPLEIIGFDNPFSSSENDKKKMKTERRLAIWAKRKKSILIAGHTHRAVFPEPGKSLYFNDGCCVHSQYITAIEITNGSISLVKWLIKAGSDGVLYVAREVLKGPVKIEAYYPAK